MAIDTDRLAFLYSQRKPLLRKAQETLKHLVNEVIGEIEDRKLVRVKIENVRPKKLSSLIVKAERCGWTAENALANASDLIGIRLTCNNLKDVYMVVELIKEKVPSTIPPDIQDYFNNPKKSGYRGIHINIRVEVREAMLPEYVGCEIQIMTLLQHAWAEINHYDIYKEGDDLPEDLHERSNDLARILSTADEIAQRIRDRAAQERTPPDQRPSLTDVNENTLTFVFADVFGRNPSELAVSESLATAKKEQLNTLAEVNRLAHDGQFRESLNDAYFTISGWQLGAEDLFSYLPIAASQGKKQALSAVRQQAKEEKAEIESIWGREVLSDLPDSYEEFLREIVNDRIDVYSIAKVWGCLSDCSYCGTEIIDEDSFEEFAKEHYEITGDDNPFEGVLSGHGIEVGDYEYSHLCAYHGDRERKDN